MATINGKACVVNGTPVDKVFSNGRQVYGRNLYLDTKDITNSNLWYANENWTKQPDKYNGLAVMQTTVNWNGLSQYIQVKKGDILTYSVYAKNTSGTGESNIYWKIGTEGSYITATVDSIVNWVAITDSWQRVSCTTVATSDGYLRPRLERTTNNTNTLQIAGIKVEKSTIATPYSQAPEDVLNGYIAAPRNLTATVIDLSTEKLDWE